MAQTTTPPPVAPVAVPCRNGILSWLWSLLGSNTPAYSGAGQPAPAPGRCGWFSTTPSYETAKQEPAPEPKGDEDPVPQGTVNIVIRRE